jgi:cytochrome c oxidase cbb3-type subunit I
VWVSFAVVFFGTLARRRIQHIYVANWYYGAFIIAVGLLHIVNNIAVPVSLFKSYVVYSGAVDAMVQWWYGHNAVAFFLTAGFLGMMYYFVPRQAQQPLWSYRFSIVNFWALISIYMWAGPHHLLYSAMPDWVQSVGMAFSVILLMPSLGSAANGLLTFNGSWDKLKTDPAAKFMVVSLIFYAASTFEGSVLAIKSVNSLSHYTDWTVAHVHSGAIGWVAMITIGSLYAMAPRALDRPAMHSRAAMELHFWLHTVGVIVYAISMWAAGITEGSMWRATNPDGSLTYSFLQSLIAVWPYYVMRTFGGALVLSGMVVMAWNLWHTAELARAHKIKPIIVPIILPHPEPIPEPVPDQVPPPRPAPSARPARI